MPDKNDMILDRQFLMTDGLKGRVDRIRDLYTTFNPEVDLEAFKRDGYVEAVGEMMEPITMSLNDRSPEVLAYWAKRGVVKEFHGDLDVMDWENYAQKTGYRWQVPPHAVQNRFKRWTSFVPVSAFAPENKGRKYPVVIVLHGGFNPTSIIDGWGFPQEAAKREWIVIVPSLELDDILDEILAQAAELYPVDESRIYLTGFSYGGFMTNTIANKRPDVYAAAAPCGAPPSNGYVGNAIGPEPQTPFDGVARSVAMGTYMPFMTVSGNLDGHRFPVYAGKNYRTGEDQAEELLEGINHWARTNKAKEFPLEEVMALKDKEGISDEEKYLGLPLAPECRHTVVADGITNYIADLPSDDGIVRTRIMVEMNMPHWPTPEMVRQIFAFFSHFRRDRKTGESIYVE